MTICVGTVLAAQSPGGEGAGGLGVPWAPGPSTVCPCTFESRVTTLKAVLGGARWGGNEPRQVLVAAPVLALQSQKLPEGGGLPPSRSRWWGEVVPEQWPKGLSAL